MKKNMQPERKQSCLKKKKSPNLYILLLEQKEGKEKKKRLNLNPFLEKAKVSSELEVRLEIGRQDCLCWLTSASFQSLNSRHLYQTCS